MFFELIATFAAGIGVAGLVMVLNVFTGGRLPRSIIPVAAGLAMLGYTIWSEYSWAGRVTAELPEGLVVIHSAEEKKYWKPWTYLAPQTTRLMTLDTRSIRKNPDAPDTQMVDLYLFARWSPTAIRLQLVNCEMQARSVVTDKSLADPAAANWITAGADDPLIRAICKG